LIVTFTLSPAFQAAGAVACGEGLGAGVAVASAVGLAAGFTSGEVDSHAPSSRAKANTQISFVVIFVAPVLDLQLRSPGRLPLSAARS
jgi:hypothetical protein